MTPLLLTMLPALALGSPLYAYSSSPKFSSFDDAEGVSYVVPFFPVNKVAYMSHAYPHRYPAIDDDTCEHHVHGHRDEESLFLRSGLRFLPGVPRDSFRHLAQSAALELANTLVLNHVGSLGSLSSLKSPKANHYIILDMPTFTILEEPPLSPVASEFLV